MGWKVFWEEWQTEKSQESDGQVIDGQQTVIMDLCVLCEGIFFVGACVPEATQ